MNPDHLRNRIVLIADGVPLRLDNMTIRINDTGKLMVTGWTNTTYFENITRDKVLQELADLKTSYLELTHSFGELNEIVRSNNLDVEFHMAYSDSGKSGIGLCSEIDGNLNWYIG